MPNNTDSDGTPVDLDEIEPETVGAGETGESEPPECEDSPTGQHEFDSGDDEAPKCVYCGIEQE